MSFLKNKKVLITAAVALAVLVSTFVFGSNKNTLDDKDIEKATKAALEVIPLFGGEYSKTAADPDIIDDVVAGGEDEVTVIVGKYSILYDRKSETITRITCTEKNMTYGKLTEKDLSPVCDELMTAVKGGIMSKADKVKRNVSSSEYDVDITYELLAEGVTFPIGAVCYHTDGKLFDAVFSKEDPSPDLLSDAEKAVSQEKAVEIAREAMISTLKEKGYEPEEVGLKEDQAPSLIEKRVEHVTKKVCWKIEFEFFDERGICNGFDIFVDIQTGEVVANANSFT